LNIDCSGTFVKGHTLYMVDDEKARKIAEILIEKLAQTSEKKNLTYDNLAALIGTNKSTIFAIENKKNLPNLLTFIKICMALDLKLSEISKDAGF
jgi:DNA-binding XRE family transcriptional regulator